MEIVDYGMIRMNIDILPALDKRDCSDECQPGFRFGVKTQVCSIELIEFSIFNTGQLLTSNRNI